MKNNIIVLLVALCFSVFSYAQDDKVKGDRNVTVKQTLVDAFHTIIVGGDFEVELFYNSRPSVEIETDDNLHGYIAVQVKDSVLTLNTSADIRSSKKLSIKVNYGKGFSNIEARENAEIRSLTSLELDNASLKVSGSSRAYMNIKANSFRFTSLDKTKVKLNVSASNTKIEVSDNGRLDALITSTETKVDMYQRANVDIEGTTTNLILQTDNNAQFNGKNFTAKTCISVNEFASDAYLEVTDTLSLDISGASEVYLFGDPQITLNKFTDTAKLQKKEK